MKVNSKYTKEFISDHMTDYKYSQLYDYAVLLRDFKNIISKIVSQDPLKYVNMSKYEFISYFRQLYPKHISSYFDAALYTLIYISYDNKFEQIKQKIKFNKRIFVQFNFYKKNVYEKQKDGNRVLKHKKDSLKSVKYKNENTNLSTTLTYLARYGSENIIEYIKSIYESVDDDKQKFYDKILICVNKFGFERLYKLALQRRKRILTKYKNKQINFTSLTFSGNTSPTSFIVEHNKNFNSCIDSFISINVPFRKGLDIPVKYAKKYHGNLKDYKKFGNRKQYLYTIIFDEYHKRIKVLLCIDGEHSVPDNKSNYVGIDVNVKHNLFSCSCGLTYDFDRELVNEYLNELNKVDKLKKNNTYVISKGRQHKLDIYRDKIKKSNLRLISSICKLFNHHGIDHIVMENLDGSFSSSYKKNKEFDEKYTRLEHILNIASLKDEFKHIASNYDIAVSFINAEYTSLMCPICGCITKANRESQEEFKCVACGHTDNADHNASVNIKNRVEQTVFANALLKQTGDTTFIPKKLSHDKVKDKVCRCVIQLYHTNKDDIDII